MSDVPIIFLDMDGVLATHQAWRVQRHERRRDDRWIDQECMVHLNAIWQQTAAHVVVSSTWRLNRARAEFNAMLRRKGFIGTLHQDWRTKELWENGAQMRRGDEVREWLSRHPEVTAHVILDDDSDFHPDQPLVLTEFENGLTAEHAARAVAMLIGRR